MCVFSLRKDEGQSTRSSDSGTANESRLISSQPRHLSLLDAVWKLACANSTCSSIPTRYQSEGVLNFRITASPKMSPLACSATGSGAVTDNPNPPPIIGWASSDTGLFWTPAGLAIPVTLRESLMFLVQYSSELLSHHSQKTSGHHKVDQSPALSLCANACYDVIATAAAQLNPGFSRQSKSANRLWYKYCVCSRTLGSEGFGS